MNRLLLAFFLLSPAFISARPCYVPPEPLKHEIGVNLYSATNLFSWNRYWGTDVGMTTQPLSGIYYKYHFGKNVFRAGLDYEQKVLFTKLGVYEGDAFYGGFKEESILRRCGVRIGYERELGSKKLVPFVAGDITFAYQQYSGIESWTGCFSWGENVPFSEKTTEGGLSLGAGVKYKPCDRLAVTLETTAQASLYHIKSTHGYYTAADNGVGFRYNPVRTLGVSWMF